MIILLLNGIQAKVIWVRMVCPIGESICRDKQRVWKFGGRGEDRRTLPFVWMF